MKLKISNRLNLYISAILFLGISALIYHDILSSERLLNEIGLSEAKRLGTTLFDQLYTSMRLGGGRNEDRAIVERVKDIEGVEEIRIIHGYPLDAQYGTEEDERPVDRYDLTALGGNTSSVIKKVKGYTEARMVMPIFVRQECKGCHTGGVGAVSGAISVKISLKKYESVIAGHTRNFILWGVAIMGLTALSVLVTVRKRFLDPIEKLKEGTEALAEGDLGYRVNIKTKDELEDLGGAFNAMAGTLLAATVRLNDINEKYTKLVEMAADAILLKDIETLKFVDANSAASALTGYSREELFTLRTEDLYPSEKLTEYSKIFDRWIYDGKGYLHDGAVIRKDGFTVPVEIAASVLEIDGRRYIQEIWRDISERKGLEQTLRRQVDVLEDTVAERTFELNRSLKELEGAYKKLKDSEQILVQSAKLVSLGEMGAGIAHELNSPIAGILSITEAMLMKTQKDEQMRYMLEKIKDAAVRSKYIILDMLTYARPFKGQLEPIYINETLRATLTIFVSEIKTSAIEIIERFDPNLPKVNGNKGQLMEAMLNIIKNARDAMEGRGKIYISTATRTRDGLVSAVVEITDTGPGIPEEIRDRIFDPFFTTKEKGGGLNIGLGLSIAQSIVKDHGGSIEAESEPGKGATFRIMLPTAEQNV